MKNVGLLGAFDRNNYGDILFAKIFEEYSKYLNKQYEFSYYGLKKSDLRHLGGYKTQSFSKEFYKLDKINTFILVGGDVLTVGWYSMARCFCKNTLSLKIYDLIFKFTPWRYKDKVFRSILGAKTQSPWLISKLDFKDKKNIIYNSVGGTNFRNYSIDFKKYFSNIVSNIDYISVRDRDLKTAIEETNVDKNINLSPDSALIMSKLFPISKLETLISNEVKELELIKKKYFVLQVKDTVGNKNVDILAKEINSIYEKTGYGVVLLPIGRASGHSDHIPLEKISKKLKFEFYLPKENTIYDTMYLIAKSELYVGTSLHGAITALSYGKPHYALTNEIEKLNEFLKTWSLPSFHQGIEPKEFSNRFDQLINVEKTHIMETKEELISKIEKNFENIFQIIEK